MLEKVQIWTSEESERRGTIRKVLLEPYPYEGMVQEETLECSTAYSFLIKRQHLNLLRHDLRTLRMCGFRVEEVEAQ